MTIALARSVSQQKDAQVLYVDSDVALGCDDDVFLVLWRDRTTLEGVETLKYTFSRYAEQRGRDAALITIIAPGAKMPSPGSREPLAAWLNQAGNTLLISAVAFEGDGFMAAGIRSVVIGLTILARQSFPHRVFKNVQEASAWIESEHSEIGKLFPAQSIQASVGNFREKLSLKRIQRSGTHSL